MRPGVMLGTVVALLAFASCADRVAHRKSAKHSADWGLDHKSGLVTHVADGDTLDIDFDDPDPPIRVRLLGVDSPELGTTFGADAKEYTFTRCNGKRVAIRLDQLQGTRDRYDRLLAYVYLPNHELLNNSLVRDGHAFAYRPKKCDFSSLFETTENQARSKKTGMWKSITLHDMPEWRQRWMTERGLK
jgi:endonuclease YncB( thermonuclease family)